MLAYVQRLRRRLAGDLVAARLTRFSTDLLTQEVACFTAVEAAFQAAAGDVERVLGRAGAGRHPPPAVAWRGLEPVLLATQLAVRKPVARLARVGAELALESMADELGICERTLPARFAGVASAGVTAAEGRTPALTKDVLAGYSSTEPAVAAQFKAEAMRQLALSKDAGEPVVTLLDRFTRQTGPALPGLPSRGVWWRPPTTVKAAARHAVIGLTNAVREAAMAGMNEAHRQLNS